MFECIQTGVKNRDLTSNINFTSDVKVKDVPMWLSENTFQYKVELRLKGYLTAKNQDELHKEKYKLMRLLSEQLYGCYRGPLYRVDYLLQCGDNEEARKLVGEIIESMFENHFGMVK